MSKIKDAVIHTSLLFASFRNWFCKLVRLSVETAIRLGSIEGTARAIHCVPFREEREASSRGRCFDRNNPSSWNARDTSPV